MCTITDKCGSVLKKKKVGLDLLVYDLGQVSGESFRFHESKRK